MLEQDIIREVCLIASTNFKKCFMRNKYNFAYQALDTDLPQ